VPIYLAVDLGIIATLYSLFSAARQVLVGTALWYWPILYIPFGLLFFFERSDAPFVFNKMMGKWRLVGLSIVLTCILLAMRAFFITVASALPFEYSPCFPPTEPFVAGVLGTIHAGLSEEPFKAFWINAIALVLQNRFRFRIGKYSLNYQLKIKRDAIWIAGIISVGFWAVLHVPLACYLIFDFTVAFVAGLVLFVALLRTRDLRLVIIAHVLYDYLVPIVFR
jgi:membrane protease YdiL (CAAX protease family)